MGNSETEPKLDIVHLEQLKQWIGRTETRSDVVTVAPVAALAATLDRADALPQPGETLPPLWHWLYFLPVDRQSDLGADGHAAARRFSASGSVAAAHVGGRASPVPPPLRVGEAITRMSRIVDVKLKQGRTGRAGVRAGASRNRQRGRRRDHRGARHRLPRRIPRQGEPAVAPIAAPADFAWRRTIRPDEVLLFRYSALTFNGHRIHYDRRYATEVEGYPGLVVHGPLIATLLLDLLRRSLPHANVARFQFRAVSPLFDGAPFAVCGKPVDGGPVRLWAQNTEGALAMNASVDLVDLQDA